MIFCIDTNKKNKFILRFITFITALLIICFAFYLSNKNVINTNNLQRFYSASVSLMLIFIILGILIISHDPYCEEKHNINKFTEHSSNKVVLFSIFVAFTIFVIINSVILQLSKNWNARYSISLLGFIVISITISSLITHIISERSNLY